MTGHRTTLKGGKINYKVLRRINPEAARLAVIEYLKTNKGNLRQPESLGYKEPWSMTSSKRRKRGI
jgi:hypothetical protein